MMATVDFRLTILPYLLVQSATIPKTISWQDQSALFALLVTAHTAKTWQLVPYVNPLMITRISKPACTVWLQDVWIALILMITSASIATTQEDTITMPRINNAILFVEMGSMCQAQRDVMTVIISIMMVVRQIVRLRVHLDVRVRLHSATLLLMLCSLWKIK